MGIEVEDKTVASIGALAQAAMEPRIVETAGATFVLHQGAMHDVRTMMRPFMQPTLQVASLQGLVDYMASSMDGEGVKVSAALVVSHVEVRLLGDILSERSGLARPVVALAKLDDVQPFGFGQWYDQQAFIIGLMTRFIATRERDELVSLVSKLSAGETHESEDDGIAQSVTIKARAGVMAERRVNPIVHLQPYRTFREVEQPTSPFLLRMQSVQGGGVPVISLHEADGGLWRVEARTSIGQFLETNCPDLTILS